MQMFWGNGARLPSANASAHTGKKKRILQGKKTCTTGKKKRLLQGKKTFTTGKKKRLLSANASTHTEEKVTKMIDTQKIYEMRAACKCFWVTKSDKNY